MCQPHQAPTCSCPFMAAPVDAVAASNFFNGKNPGSLMLVFFMTIWWYLCIFRWYVFLPAVFVYMFFWPLPKVKLWPNLWLFPKISSGGSWSYTFPTCHVLNVGFRPVLFYDPVEKKDKRHTSSKKPNI